MTPAARVQAAINVLDAVIAAARAKGAPADRIMADWARANRYAGSKDRRAIRELVFGAIRVCGPAPSDGRAAMLALAERTPGLAFEVDENFGRIAFRRFTRQRRGTGVGRLLARPPIVRPTARGQRKGEHTERQPKRARSHGYHHMLAVSEMVCGSGSMDGSSIPRRPERTITPEPYHQCEY